MELLLDLCLQFYHFLCLFVLLEQWRSQEALPFDVLLSTALILGVGDSTPIFSRISIVARLSEPSCPTLTPSCRWSGVPRERTQAANSKVLRLTWMHITVTLTLILEITHISALFGKTSSILIFAGALVLAVLFKQLRGNQKLWLGYSGQGFPQLLIRPTVEVVPSPCLSVCACWPPYGVSYAGRSQGSLHSISRAN